MDHTAQASFIQWLLGPDHAETFLEKVWGKKLLVAHSQNSLRDLFDVDALDQILSVVPISNNNFSMAQHHTPLPEAAYCNGSRVDMARAFAEHRKGATIILRAFEQWSEPLASLCRAAQDTFHVPAQTNLYLTPAGNQSTPPHWDTHDIFILQIHGEKLWKFYESSYELPLDEQRFRMGTHQVGKLTHEVMLRPGDVLYMPRGFIHEPVAKDYSVHVSLGMHIVRWVDLMIDALRLASQHDRSLREAPLWSSGHAGSPAWEEVARGLQKRLESAFSHADCFGAVRSRIDAAIAKLAPDVRGRLSEQARGGALGPESQVRRSPGVAYLLEEDRAGVKLRWGAKSLALRSELRPVLEFILNEAVFSPRSVPGAFSESEKVNLVRTLLDGGLLSVLPPDTEVAG